MKKHTQMGRENVTAPSTARMPPPHPTPPHCLLRRRDMEKPYPPRGEGRKGRGSVMGQ